MIKIQQFAPDTCACVVLETWDDALAGDQVVFGLAGIVHRGDEHLAILDDSLYAVIREENYRKNVCQFLAATMAAVAFNEVAWSFTPGRLLQLSFPNVVVDQATKTSIQLACDDKVGLGKVVVS